MTILLTGGFGKTASRIASLLQKRGVPTLIASRRGQDGVPAPYKGVVFDWDNSSTYQNPFKEDPNVDTVYLVLASSVPSNTVNIAKDFISVARENGVKRFVFLSASALEKGGPFHGQVHEYLAGLGVDYTVLRPSWFFENFLTSITPDGSYYSSAGGGKVGLIAVEDIAEAAVQALTAEASPNTNPDQILVGPELWTYAQAAEQLTKILGKPVAFKSLTVQQYAEQLTKFGLDKEFSEGLARMTGGIAEGAEERIFDDSRTIHGKVKLEDWIEANKEELRKKLA